MSDSCIVDFSNRHIFYADKLVDIRKQCWIVLEALINAKLQNRNLTYEQMDQLLWDDTLGLDLSKKQAIQDCIRDLRVAIGDTLIENCRGYGYCLTVMPTVVPPVRRATEDVIDAVLKSLKIEVRDYGRISAELQPIEQTIYDLQEKMNNLIQQAEKTKEKLTKAINDGNQFWISLYSRQLALHMGAQEELFYLFIEIEKQRGWYENIISQLKDCKDDFCQAESHDKQDQNTAFIRYDLSMDYTPLLKLAEDVARMRESLKTNEYKLYEVMKSIEEADQAQAEELKLLEEQINANGASLLFSEDRM